MAPTIIHSVLLFDGNSIQQDATVSFDSLTGLITSVSQEKSSFPQGATVIDGKGHTLLPGLIESHMHVHGLHLPEGSDENDILRSPLKSGVTTVCDMHSDFGVVNSWRNRIADEVKQAKAGGGTVSLSDLKTALLGATIEGGWPGPIVLGPNPTEEVILYPRNGWPQYPSYTRHYPSLTRNS
jgi:dihydroorotase-like cyclic amidohydrolase